MVESVDVVLARYSLLVQPDGQVATRIANIDPKEFVKACTESDPKWEDAKDIARLIEFVTRQFEVFDKELAAYLAAL